MNLSFILILTDLAAFYPFPIRYFALTAVVAAITVAAILEVGVSTPRIY